MLKRICKKTGWGGQMWTNIVTIIFLFPNIFTITIIIMNLCTKYNSNDNNQKFN